MSEDLHALANDVRLAAQRLSRRVRFEGTAEVAPHQFSVLVRLAQRPHTPGELAEGERISAPSMTRTVNGLVAAGYVTKVCHPEDGRQRVLTLTPAGQEVVRRTISDRDDWMLQRLERLDAGDHAALRRAADILNRVVAE